ncbi:hypothetical protein [Stenotrophomonas sp.]|uniref:hypothetical protein n=1 Tax=Stenotrophomonas sp. TaxID=69392 RepID=UPI0028A640E7|nr:hypothetical protein [Stenotrophomonas sp.]
MKLAESQIPELRHPVALAGSNMANMETSTITVAVGVGIGVGIAVGVAVGIAVHGGTTTPVPR